MNKKRNYRHYVKALGAWVWLIALGVLLAGGTSFILTASAKVQYEATTTLVIGQFLKQVNPNQNDVDVTERLSTYYLDLLTRKPVLEGVKSQLQLDLTIQQLAGLISARVVPSTSLIEIKVTSIDSTRAVRVANALAQQLMKQSPAGPDSVQNTRRDFITQQLDDLSTKINNGRKDLDNLNQTVNTSATTVELTDTRNKIKALEGQIDAWQSNYIQLLRELGTTAPNTVNVLEEANQARKVEGLNPFIGALIAALAGAALALVFAVIMEYLDDRIKRADDLEHRFDLNILGTVSRDSLAEAQAEGLPVVNSHLDQVYEVIATGLAFAPVFEGQRKSLLIASLDNTNIHSQIALSLAKSMLSFEQSVLLVDATVREPQIHKLLGLPGEPGFYESFYGGSALDLETQVQPTNLPKLYMLPAGNVSAPAQSIAVLQPGTQQIYNLPEPNQPYSFVIFNGDGILTDKTTRLLAARVTATVLVCELGYTRGQELKAALEVIERLKGQTLGVVLINRPPLLDRWKDRLQQFRSKESGTGRHQPISSAAAQADAESIVAEPTPALTLPEIEPEKAMPVAQAEEIRAEESSPLVQLEAEPEAAAQLQAEPQTREDGTEEPAQAEPEVVVITAGNETEVVEIAAEKETEVVVVTPELVGVAAAPQPATLTTSAADGAVDEPDSNDTISKAAPNGTVAKVTVNPKPNNKSNRRRPYR